MAKHLRIDEGIKRARRERMEAKAQVPAQLQKSGIGEWKIPAGLDPDDVLRDFLLSETTSNISVKYGVNRRALTKWLRTKQPAEWKEVQRIRALVTKEEGGETIYNARDALQLAKGRELLRAGQWELERLDPEYSPKQELTHKLDPELTAQLERAERRIIDVTPAQEELEAPAEKSGNAS